MHLIYQPIQNVHICSRKGLYEHFPILNFFPEMSSISETQKAFRCCGVKCIKTRIENCAVNLYIIGYTYKFFIYKFQLVLPWYTTLGSEVKVQLKTILTQHDLKPQAVTCQLWTLKISILSNPFQFILHLSIAGKE